MAMLRMQRTKIRALGLGKRVDSILYCAELSRSKPDPEVFHYALREPAWLLRRPSSSAIIPCGTSWAPGELVCEPSG